MWRTPEELVAIGFERSRVVMMNEFHDGLLRMRWTREIGRRILPAAHQAGVRYLAMETLNSTFATEGNRTRQVPESRGGYLAQSDMRDLIQTALDLGLTLLSYEADMAQLPAELTCKDRWDQTVTNWREERRPPTGTRHGRYAGSDRFCNSPGDFLVMGNDQATEVI